MVELNSLHILIILRELVGQLNLDIESCSMIRESPDPARKFEEVID